MLIKGNLHECRLCWLRTHVRKMYRAEAAAEQSCKKDEIRSLNLEAAANADSVLELLPTLFTQDDGLEFLTYDTDKSGLRVSQVLWTIEAECYNKLSWRAQQEGNGDIFTDTGRRYFIH